MKKFLVFCIIALVACTYYNSSNAATPNISKGSRFITVRGIQYANSISEFERDKVKTLPSRTQITVDIYGNAFTRVRIIRDGGNGNLNGKFVYVRTIHLKQFCMRN